MTTAGFIREAVEIDNQTDKAVVRALQLLRLLQLVRDPHAGSNMFATRRNA